MKIGIAFGTRPEIIKLAPFIRSAARAGHELKLIFTGQHAQMAGPLMEFFEIEPDLSLEVMRPDQTLTGLSARVLEELDAKLGARGGLPEILVVQGDTTTAFVAAYWAFCRRIRVAHVEAGLRTHDLAAPFPEEGNRQLISRIADLHFAPTDQARRTLVGEALARPGIHVVGNPAIDALHFTLDRLDAGEVPERQLPPRDLRDFIGEHRLVLVTAHRRESFGTAFDDLCEGIRRVADAHEDVRVVYPVHPNPNVRRPVEKLLGGHPRIRLCEPQGYVAFVSLMKRADVLLTDSGGVQEEGPSLEKPIVVLREKTERPEGVDAGYAVLVGTDPARIVEVVDDGLKNGCRGRGGNPYGDGRSAARILEAIEGK